jgi:alkanesulfonate monooxygenase SsuD/methylene tetrahydromethanopterin reductase-like flavin-dependent oxidoreductase (luciferase family)
MTTPRLGVIFRPQHSLDRLRATAVAADETGLDELWLWEDCFDHGGIASAAAALAWTQRLHVGIGVLPVPLRNVALAGMEIATLGRLFPGRIEVGLGHGVLDWMGQVGARAESPMTLLREYVTALRGLLAGETVTAQGRYVRLDGVALGWAPAAPLPVQVAGIRPKTLALAGELADGLILTGSTTPAEIRAARAIFESGRGERPGRITVYLATATGPDAADRLATLQAAEGMPAASGVAGPADVVAAAVLRWAAAGADAVILEPLPDDDPEAFARFAGEDVLPRLG